MILRGAPYERHKSPENHEFLAKSDRLLAVRMTAQAPATLSGIPAKARAAVLLWAGPQSDFTQDDDTTTLARSLLTDLAGMPEASSGQCHVNFFRMT